MPTPTPRHLPPSPFKPHPNSVVGWKLSSQTFIAIDEVGSVDTSGSEFLMVAAVAAKDTCPELPEDLCGYHAVEDVKLPIGGTQGATKLKRLITESMKQDVALIGLDFRNYPQTSGRIWAAVALELVAWVLDTAEIPAGEDITITVRLEQRSEYTAGQDLSAAASHLLHGRALREPERFARVTLKVGTVAKEGRSATAPINRLNGLVDAIAYAWRGNLNLEDRATFNLYSTLQKLNLINTCLFENAADLVSNARKLMEIGLLPDGAVWNQLLERAHRTPQGFEALLLQRLAQRCASDSSLWFAYLNDVHNHLESKAIDMTMLGLQLDWLQSCKPHERQWKPREELAMLLAEIARKNHQGSFTFDKLPELIELTKRLREEAPSLACQADLQRAVYHTNRYEFAEASKTLILWNKLGAAAVGTNLVARVLSSLGQHQAFLGNHQKAQDYFKRAIAKFQSLSDPEEAQKETTQTRTYQCISAMDELPANRTALRALMTEHFGKFSAEQLSELASSSDREDKYRLHTLLRYAAQARSSVIDKIVIEAATPKVVASGHPWQLIQAYRAIILKRGKRPEQAIEHLRSALQIATGPECSGVVHLHAQAFAAILTQWGDPQEPPKEQPAPPPGLPAYPHRLKKWDGNDPLDLLKALFPFNFR